MFMTPPKTNVVPAPVGCNARVAAAGMLRVKNMDPPDQMVLDVAVREPLPDTFPALKFRLATVVALDKLKAEPLLTMAVSPAPGTPLGDQLSPFDQVLSPEASVYV